jgi:FkbM family methyltransferase
MPEQSPYSEKENADGGFSVSDLPNRIDVEFERLMEFIKGKDVPQIKADVIQNLRHFQAANSRLYRSTVDYYNRYRLWGTYDPEREDDTLAQNRASALVEHRADFEWLYRILGDYRSKRILVNILYYWLMSDPGRIEQIHDKTFSQYFDLDLVKCGRDEVFVDIGGYIGDTLVDYAKMFGKDCYKRLYCYEIVPANLKYIEENIRLFQLDNVIVREKGAGSKNGTMYLSSDQVSSTLKLSESGALSVPVVRIDDDIGERVTFIKMDIEGGEEEALYGCLETIRKYHPKLALSVYHNHKDLWKLARIIAGTDSSYRFYLRYYGSPILPAEYLLYAI